MILLNISFKYKFINKMRCADTVESSGGSGSIPTSNVGSDNSLNEIDDFAVGKVVNSTSCCFFSGNGNTTVPNDSGILSGDDAVGMGEKYGTDDDDGADGNVVKFSPDDVDGCVGKEKSSGNPGCCCRGDSSSIDGSDVGCADDGSIGSINGDNVGGSFVADGDDSAIGSKPENENGVASSSVCGPINDDDDGNTELADLLDGSGSIGDDVCGSLVAGDDDAIGSKPENENGVASSSVCGPINDDDDGNTELADLFDGSIGDDVGGSLVAGDDDSAIGSKPEDENGVALSAVCGPIIDDDDGNTELADLLGGSGSVGDVPFIPPSCVKSVKSEM